jgi:ankyrin repeat protein
MGACCTSDESKHKKTMYRKSRPDMKVEGAPEDASVDFGRKGEKPINRYIRNGDVRIIQGMISNGEIDVNDYIFGSNKTILHEAVLSGNSADLVECVLDNKADINLPEKETGNTALFLAGLDLKVDMVKVLVKYRPDLKIKNNNNQDIFQCLKSTLVNKDNKNGGYYKKAEMTNEEHEKYRLILEILSEYKHKTENAEVLDESENRRLKKNLDNDIRRI